jgi:predicted GIY-YIG superfamily endonuclease
MISEIQIYGLFDPLTDELRYVGMTSQTLHKRLTKHISESKIELSKMYGVSAPLICLLLNNKSRALT